MRSKTKRILALLCAVVLVATTFLGNWYTKQSEVKAADSVEPISLEGFKNVTVKDFSKDGEQMPEGEYPCTDATNGNNSYYSLTDGTSLDGKLLSMKVKFTHPNGNARLDVGGSGEWSGFMVYPSGDGSQLYVVSNNNAYGTTDTFLSTNIPATTVGVTSYLNNEFLLQIAFDFGETDSNNRSNIKVIVFVNGVKGTEYTFESCNMAKFGGYMGVYRQGEGCAVTVNSVKWPAEPAWPEGFTYLTIKNFQGLTPGTLTGVSTGAHKDYAAINQASFDNVLLSMNVTFTSGGYKTRLDIGGNAAWTGFSVHPSGDGNSLEIRNNYSMTTTADLPTLSASVAGVDSFIGSNFLLQMSFEYGEVVNDRADVTIGVYIEGKLYNNQKFTIADCDMKKMGNHLAFYSEAEGGNITYGNVIAPIEPVYLDDFGNLTISDFVDGSGNVLTAGEYAGASTGAHGDYYVKGLTNFDKKLVSLNVTFEGGSHRNSIIIGGNDGWCGFNFHPSDDGSQLVVDKTWGGSITSSSTPSLSATTAGLSSFINNEFLLQISFEYGEVVSDKADLTMGIYIDGKLYNNQTFTIASCSTGTWGTHMALYREVEGQSMIIGDEVKFDEFAGFTEVTVEDFVDASGNVMESKAYTTTVLGAYDVFSLKDYDNFDKKKLALNVMFKYGDGKTRIDLAGASAWNGVSMWTNTAGSYLYVGSNYGGVSSGSPEFPINISKDSVGISSFLNTKFLLEMTFKYVSDNQIEIGIYVDGVLANNQKYTLTVSDMAKFGDYIGFYREADESAILIGSVNSTDFPVDMGIQPSYRYDKLTFGHFGITDGTYPGISSNVAVQGHVSGRTTLDRTVICGSILYEGSNSSQIIWGGKSDWNGLRMFPNSDGHMALTWYEGGTATSIATLDSATAGVKFVGEKYDIMLSSELIDNGGDGNVNDIKIGIWFNGVLYNQQYFIATDLGDKYGNYFSVYCANETDAVTLGSVMELLEQPADDLKKVTFFQYGIEDGTYESAADINTKGTYIKGDIAGTVLCGDVQLINSSAGEIDIFLGSINNVWEQGIRLTKYGTSTDFKLIYQTADAYKEVLTITPSAAGVDFANEKFNLMWSMELEDSDEDGTSDDLKVGLWFNGFLYQQEYVYITNFGTDKLGNTFSTYCAAGTAITLNSIYELTNLPDKSFDKITFSDFGLETQEVVCGADVVASRKASAYNTLDKVVFSGDFRFSDAGDYQIIYGGDAAWAGLRLMIESDGNLNGSWYLPDGSSQLVIWGTPELLGLDSLTQETFNVMISTELVDDDGDGNKNDIKVGVWFNKVLYEFEGSGYHIVKDWGDQLKNGFSIYGKAGSSTSVMIRNDADYQANPYYYEDIAEYRSDAGFTYPTLDGYVFSGWYEDEAYTTAVGTDVKSGKAWAKFVDEDVLTVKPQIKVENDGSTPADMTALRFVTTVDSLDYKQVSFYIAKYNEANGAYNAEKDTATFSDENARKVYETLYYVGDTTKTLTYDPSIFSWQSAYFKTFTVEDIPSEGYDTPMKATPYWITLDGTTVRGETLETTVSKYSKPGANTSKAVSIDFLGKDTMPITGYFGPYPVSHASDTALFPDYHTDEYFKMIADSGVNLMVYSDTDYSKYPDLVKKQLTMGEKYGIGIYVKDSGIYNKSESEMLAQMSNYSNYKAFSGMYLIDEPGTSSYLSNTQNGLASSYSDEAAILNKNNILHYSNMYPIVDAESNWWEGILGSAGINDTDKTAYGKYLNEFNDALDPKVLTYDYYPFDASRTNEDGSYNLSLYFWNMAAIRDKAQSTNKPFWAFVQAGGQWNDKQEYFTSTTPYYPDEGQFDWIVNTSLAFGAQGIQYFPLVQPQHFAYGKDATHWDFNRNGIIGAFGNKTQWYDYAQEINKHIAEIDSVLMNSSSKQIIALGNNAMSATNGLNGVTTTASYNSVLTGATATGNALIGCFDYCGKTALYVVNYDYDNAGSVTLSFNGTKAIKKIENAVTSESSATSLTLNNMEPGEGILLVIE